VRPVAIETPWNVFGMKSAVTPLPPLSPLPAPVPDPAAIAAAAQLIAAARRPLIMVGAGALDAAGPVLELAELLQAPVTAHRSGKGIVSEDSALGFSAVAAWEYWSNCDLLIGIGSRLELQYLRWRWFPKDLKVIRLDIDATEMVRLRPDVAIVSDAALGTRALIEELAPAIGTRPSQSGHFNAIKERARQAIQSVVPQMAYLNVIREVLPRDGFFCEEISQVGFTARFGFPVYAPRQYVTCGYQDNLGYGFNTALGVKVAHPDKAVISVTGDGGFLFGVQELATAVQYRINLITVVFNNSGYGNVRRDQQEKYQGRLLGVDLHNPDFVKLAESFGVLGFRASSPESLKPLLERALGANSPVVIEVSCPPGGESSPWTFLHPPPPG
jgi:acetolactate synthase-1/2/3 large subunit